MSARDAGNLFQPWLAKVIVALAVVAAYANSTNGPFVLDDFGDIEVNPAIREPWPPWRPFVREVAGQVRIHARPVVVLSFAANYATGGLTTRWFHVTNIAIHLLAAMTLFEIVRRTLLLPRQRSYATSATGLALAVTLLWALHPLQTQAVTYIVQRYESLMGLFYFGTLYAALRSSTSVGPATWGWRAASLAACALAIGSKEVAISAPVIVMLFDRAFVAGSFREAWRQRWPLHALLSATWLVFVPFFLCYSGGAGVVGQGGWGGYGDGKPWLPYALNQPSVILHYLRLAIWPTGQCLDYAWVVTMDPRRLGPSLVTVGTLLAACAYLLIYRPRCGFLGAWFFLILAPTSSVLPINDLAFEHRMYLPLAALVVGAVFVAYEGLASPRSEGVERASPQWVGLVAVIAVVLGTLTLMRNQVYGDALTLWTDVVAKSPENGRAHANLGHLLLRRGQPQSALEHYEEADRLAPSLTADAALQRDWATCLLQLNRGDLAVPHFRRAIDANPNDSDIHLKLARLLIFLKYPSAAQTELRAAIRLNPNLREATAKVGESGSIDKDWRRAMVQAVTEELGSDLQSVLASPANPCNSQYENGMALLRGQDYEGALKYFNAAAGLGPDATLAEALKQAGQTALQGSSGSNSKAHRSAGPTTP